MENCYGINSQWYTDTHRERVIKESKHAYKRTKNEMTIQG